MTNILNFSSDYYKQIALSTKSIDYKTNKTAKDAFMLCIKDLPYNEVDNLCKEISKYYCFKNKPQILSQKDCYKLTQGENTPTIECDQDFKRILLNLAYQCINAGKTIGSRKRNNGNSTTSWISHCLHQGQTAATLAKSQNLDPDTAKKLGILHDIGRKYTHTLLHTVAGFEKLIDEGWIEEAFICLTHSFLGNKNQNNTFIGGRCCGCDPAVPGFYVDENGNPRWNDIATKDDITFFLETYQYNSYDLIINMSDLIATSNGPTTPYYRVTDIATRTEPDPTNRNYFKAEFSNLMLHFLQKAGEIEPDSIGKLKANTKTSDEQMDSIFHDVSELFTDYYNSISIKKIETLNKPNQK